jgi:hypothetical protein
MRGAIWSSLWIAIAAGALACTHGAASAPTAVATYSEATPKLEPKRDQPAVHIRGKFTAVDIDAISLAVRRADDQPLLSIVQRIEGVEVHTGSICGPECGGGNLFILRKVSGTWTIVERGVWAS